MMNNIRMGIPEMQELWDTFCKKADTDSLKGNEKRLFKKLVKIFKLLSLNAKHPGLCTHEISQLTKRYGMKVWQSYLENNVPSAGRIFWVYGPQRNDITVIGLEPHPDDKSDSYNKIHLDNI